MLSHQGEITEVWKRCMNQGWISVYDKMHINKVYEQYKKLDGNTYIDDIIGDINDLEVR